ncbi:MgtE_N domain-containing protein [Haematococcus lacustris]|uniref:MgtE_N domain-containing protein n=1 Tax=Haematococcus lacustris TaxID=44745 RepID=A0A699ZRJ1_HAELA|nr:MgtE_N domain-containing protein [Haematococcus lacustris]
MGPRSPDTRSGFLGQLQQAAVQVDDAEVEVKVRRDKRFEGEVLPAQFFKLPRIKFISLLCSELQRINTFITTLAEDKFARLDVERKGEVAVSSLPTYLAQMLPAATPAALLEEVQHAFLQLAGAMEKDVPADSVAMLAVTREAAGLAKLRAYLSLLAAILNLQVSTSIDGVLDCTDPSQLDSRRVEESVGRLEDVAIILLHQDKYLLATDEHVALDRIRRQPAGMRLVHRQFSVALQHSASYVFQSLWHARKARLAQANQMQDSAFEHGSCLSSSNEV